MAFHQEPNGCNALHSSRSQERCDDEVRSRRSDGLMHTEMASGATEDQEGIYHCTLLVSHFQGARGLVDAL
jgi:hypothetical protein